EQPSPPIAQLDVERLLGDDDRPVGARVAMAARDRRVAPGRIASGRGGPHQRLRVLALAAGGARGQAQADGARGDGLEAEGPAGVVSTAHERRRTVGPLRTWSAVVMLVVLSLAVPPAPARPGQAPAETPVVRAGTAAVLLDVVIRDQKGRPVPDVAAAEVEVY